MSGRFVRASQFRHVFGQPAKPAEQFLSVTVSCAGDGEYITTNGKFIAFAARGGGGPVNVLNCDKPGRMGKLPKLEVHRSRVLDFQFSPFDDDLLATCAEDNLVKISRIPTEGLTSDMKGCVQTLAAHEKKVVGLRWHPTTSNIIASCGFDHKVKVFDVESGQVALAYDSQFNDALNHIRWNYDGSLLATTSKDKFMRIFDPRDQKVAQEVACFAGSKKASCEFVTRHNQIVATGFSKTSMRQIKLYDVRNLSQTVTEEDLDQSAGVLIPFYDHDTSILFVGGKGDSSVRYYEVTGGNLHFLSQFSDTKSHKGFSFMPKTKCETTKCEIAGMVRIMSDSVVPVSFQVPRKNADTFQADLYPESRAPVPAQNSAEYLAGGNAAPNMTSMKPGEVIGAGTTEMVIKATYAELEAQLAAALARIAELEAAQA
jgi:WD40 repeat protein